MPILNRASDQVAINPGSQNPTPSPVSLISHKNSPNSGKHVYWFIIKDNRKDTDKGYISKAISRCVSLVIWKLDEPLEVLMKMSLHGHD
jgi:hypothetical protein